MSSCHSVNGRSPGCSHEQELVLWGSVNTSLDPELKSGVLNQDLLRLKCTKCSRVLTLGYPLLYNDPDEAFMIYLEPDVQAPLPMMPPMLSEYRRRSVDSPNQLTEKILALELGLDDRALEVTKLAICQCLETSYQDTLEKMGAWPLDPSGLLFAGTSVGYPLGKPLSKLTFLLLLHAQPSLPIFVEIDALVYHQVQEFIGKTPTAQINPSEWQQIDSAWARRVVGDQDIEVTIEMLIAPELLKFFPVAGSLFEKHRELTAAS